MDDEEVVNEDEFGEPIEGEDMPDFHNDDDDSNDPEDRFH